MEKHTNFGESNNSQKVLTPAELEEKKAKYIKMGYKVKNIFSQSYSSNAKTIDTIIQEYLKNKNLCKICKNYAKIDMPLKLLELSIIPLNYNEYDVNIYFGHNLKLEILDNEKNSAYINLLNNFASMFNQSLNLDSLLFKTAYLLKNKTYRDSQINSYLSADVIKKFQGFEELFNILVNQNIISQDENLNTYQYYAFLYLLYRLKKQLFFELYKTNIENLGLSIEDEENNIIEAMYNNGFQSGQITTAIWAIRSYKANFSDLIYPEIDNIAIKVDKKIVDIDEKEKINLLLNQESQAKYDIESIDLMSGSEFEQFITYMFNQMGYKASNTKLSGDQGIDVIAEKGNSKIAIQTKCYSQPVGNHAIMEAVAGAKYYNANKCMVITNSTFTKSARELAKSNNVVLWDRQILKEKLEQI